MRQESLLPGTDALTRATVEIAVYHGKLLVRFRDCTGQTWRRTFVDSEAAHTYFWECAQKLRDGD